MPIERDEIEDIIKGKTKEAILSLLSDGKGYYITEIQDKTKKHISTIRKNLAALQFEGLITSVTLSKKGSGNKKIYFLSESAMITLQLAESIAVPFLDLLTKKTKS